MDVHEKLLSQKIEVRALLPCALGSDLNSLPAGVCQADDYFMKLCPSHRLQNPYKLQENP
jgi:hypothetical protein